MGTKTFSKEFMLEEILEGDDAIIEDTIVDNTRWSIIHEIIFKHEDKFYQTSYSVGATEYQDEGPWEYEDEVKCTEVVQKEVTILQWVAKD